MEREARGITPEVESAANLIREYYREEKLGSIRLTAFFDELNCEHYVDRWRGTIEEKIKYPNHPDAPFRESRTRIDEMKIAALEAEIERKRASLPGYNRAYQDATALVINLLYSFPSNYDENLSSMENEERSKESFENFRSTVYNLREEFIARENPIDPNKNVPREVLEW